MKRNHKQRHQVRIPAKVVLHVFNFPFLRLASHSIWPLMAIATLALLVPSGVMAQRVTESATDVLKNWPQWRGPLGTGEAPQARPPLTWSEDEHVRWKTPIAGKGHSSPIIWDDRIFVTTAVPHGEKMQPRYSGAPGAHDNLPVTQRHRFLVMAVDREDGRLFWEKQVNETLPHEGGHFTASLASASPVTDGQRVFAFFGSHGLFCLDFDGNLIWQKDLGRMQSKHGHGEGCSPALHGNRLIINWDHEGESFIVVFDARDGTQLWKRQRPEVTSWSSPVVVVHQGRAQVIVAGTNRLRGYDLETGDTIWECGGLSANVVATPIAADGYVYVGSSYDTRAMFAIKLDGAEGDITGTEQIVWHRRRLTPYVPSPLLYGGALYFLRHYQGVMTRVIAKTGDEPTGPFRLERLRDIYASPVAANGHLYVTDRHGVTVVMSAGEVPRLVAVNQLADRISASAAICGDDLVLRGEQYLYCLSEK